MSGGKLIADDWPPVEPKLYEYLFGILVLPLSSSNQNALNVARLRLLIVESLEGLLADVVKDQDRTELPEFSPDPNHAVRLYFGGQFEELLHLQRCVLEESEFGRLAFTLLFVK